MTSLERPLPGRFIAVDGCFNFRDLGGYRTGGGRRVRTGTVYRSDGLHRLSTDGLKAFSSLDVMTVIDLRTDGEVVEQPWPSPPQWPGRWLHIALRDSTPTWESDEAEQPRTEDFAVTHYLKTAQQGGAALRGILTVLAEPSNLPAVFHCAAGKDRTGIVAGVLLALLGVPPEMVAEDYALSEIATRRWQASIAAGARDDTQTAWGYVPAAMLVAEARTMLGFLARLEQLHGSIEGFASAIGIADSTIRELSDTLLE